jgi:hypothetical protein
MTDKIKSALEKASDVLDGAKITTDGIDARHQARQEHDEENPNSLLSRVKNISLAARRINKVWDAAQNLYNSVVPYVSPLIKPAVWTAGKIKDAFIFAAFDRDENGPKRDVLSPETDKLPAVYCSNILSSKSEKG